MGQLEFGISYFILTCKNAESEITAWGILHGFVVDIYYYVQSKYLGMILWNWVFILMKF